MLGGKLRNGNRQSKMTQPNAMGTGAQQRFPPEALYLPFEAGPHRMLMGLVARHPNELIEIDEAYPAEMEERRALLGGRRDEVFAALAVSEQARREALDRIAAVLPARYPAWFARHGDRLCNRLTGEEWDVSRPPCDPLELAGRLVQEDLCLIQPTDAGPVLQAAVLCAPSRWRLHEKIGRPLAVIHRPVPLYADQLSAPVDRFIRHLKAGKLAERLNWSVTDDPALFQIEGKHRTQPDPTITAANAASRLFLPVERQTLSRLPGSGFVLFTIRVHSYPLTRVLAQTGVAARLAEALRALPASMAAYKSLPPFRDALLIHLHVVSQA